MTHSLLDAVSVYFKISVKVTANVVGNFPGSPVRLDHVFGLAGEKIKSLEIG